jgi:hypothetical protein
MNNNSDKKLPSFKGDISPGVGGSMLFGPGNPDFGKATNGARFEPYSPLKSDTGNPTPDQLPKPGPKNQ